MTAVSCESMKPAASLILFLLLITTLLLRSCSCASNHSAIATLLAKEKLRQVHPHRQQLRIEAQQPFEGPSGSSVSASVRIEEKELGEGKSTAGGGSSGGSGKGGGGGSGVGSGGKGEGGGNSQSLRQPRDLRSGSPPAVSPPSFVWRLMFLFLWVFVFSFFLVVV